MAETKCYIYSFWNNKDEIIYIGKTYRNLFSRLREHRHLGDIYNQVTTIKFFEVDGFTLCDLTEIALINYYCPKGNNKDLHQNERLPSELLKLLLKEWKTLDNEIFNLLDFGKKTKKEPLSPEQRKEAQKIGIEKAKALGKYTGRKHRDIDWKAFGLLYNDNKQGKITKIEMEKVIGCSRPTLLRYIKEYEEMNKNEMQST